MAIPIFEDFLYPFLYYLGQKDMTKKERSARIRKLLDTDFPDNVKYQPVITNNHQSREVSSLSESELKVKRNGLSPSFSS